MIVQVGWPRVNRIEDVAAPEKIEVHSKDRSRDRVHCGHLIVLCFGDVPICQVIQVLEQLCNDVGR